MGERRLGVEAARAGAGCGPRESHERAVGLGREGGLVGKMVDDDGKSWRMAVSQCGWWVLR